MRCEHLHDSAAYVLGALSPQEREAYEQHMEGCAACRAEVADLAVLPGLLARLDSGTAQAIGSGAAAADLKAVPTGVPPILPPAAKVDAATEPGAEDPVLSRVLDRVAAKRRAERRRRRWQVAGAALAAACLGVFAAIGVRAAGVGSPSNPPTTATPSSAPTPPADLVAMREVAAVVPITARMALEPAQRGTTIRMWCAYRSGTRAGTWVYQLVVVPKVGPDEELNSWTAGYGDEYEMTGYTRLARQDIRRVEIRKADGTTLLVLDL